jgi:CheY-specific phosphatase CheX
MDHNEVRTALMAAVADVLETMCFAGIVECSEEVAPSHEQPEAEFRAALEFRGEPGGNFRLAIPRPLARELGAGFLGLESTEVSETQAGEVVCELANMICGSVLSRLENKGTFHITHPELVFSALPAVGCSDIVCWFDLGDGGVLVEMGFQQAA